MSYILDALRKADAQRERDPARGIHAQPLRAAAGLSPPRSGSGPGLWIAAAAVLGALASASWYVYRDVGKSTPAQQERVATAARVPTAGAAFAQAQTAPVVGNPASAPAVAPPAPVPPPAPASSPTPATLPAPAIVPPAPARQLPTAPAANSRGTSLPMMRGGPQPGTAPAPATTTAPGAAPPAAFPRPAISAPVPAAAPTPPVAGLPPDAPKLVLSGGVYSASPAQRMLIVNGQVFNEGSEVGPGVVLEAINARTVVLRFRGSRYTVAY